ncbi:hypothetical protein LPTSP3_g24310 [Leptospira kobayashii]|uniref:Uncharacterized protein n=1 Tax=Leptospira kobayashii TaxID=1917830 RepID=A0ABN6KHH5_9LEPT|nr:hypothetical protein [Leptospira kobayashii]BDA79501.1 hypothetical protein LPTSP3_g24310 [Leptospira kobayashii]
MKIKNVSFLFIFSLWVSSLSSSSVWIPEELELGKEAKSCYKPLKDWGIGMLSKNSYELESNSFQNFAKESANLRLSSLACLRGLIKKESDKNAILSGYEFGISREDHLFRLELRILTSTERDFPLTPIEMKSVKDWTETRGQLVEGIRNLTRDGLMYSDKDWENKKGNLEEEIRARYGSLVREREKFLFSLSIESRASYLNYLAKFTENSL